MTDLHSPSAAIEEYVAACKDLSTDRLQKLFHPNALMSGYFLGEFYSGSPEPFYDEIREYVPKPEGSRTYVATITSSEIFGNIANVVLAETAYLGEYDLVNLFQLVETESGWKIISKTFTDS